MLSFKISSILSDAYSKLPKSEIFLMGIIVAAITAPFDCAIFVIGWEYFNSRGPAELYAAIENW